MIKKKITITLIMLYVSILCFANDNRSFTIETMDGLKKRIDVSYTRGSTGLAVSCSSDRIYLDSYSATRKIEVLQRKFLKITYSEHGGTGIESVKTAIISVVKDKIVICAYFGSIYNVDVLSKNNQSLVESELSINHNKEYLLIAKSNQKFKDADQAAVNTSKVDTLNFDRKNFVFRTGYEHKSKKYNVYDSKTDRQTKQFISGKFPVNFR